MKDIKKNLVYSTVVFIVVLCVFPAFASASFPPEWVGASGFSLDTGTVIEGDYTDTWHDDSHYHKIRTEKSGSTYEAIFSYKFAGKCSKVRILVGETPGDRGEDYTAWVYYEDGTNQELGDFDGFLYSGSVRYFTLNHNKYLKNIKIRYYDTRGSPPPANIDLKFDWIQAYWTGIF
ncbi:MAG: hypothetical protein KAV01_02890 [Candidatus Lokiarchaeota archaeon]|nr:hypothetical protein [Candidatus Lokiarchaeota archaeon]